MHDSENRADFNNPSNPQIVAHFVINNSERDALAQYFILFAKREPRRTKFPGDSPSNPRAWIKLDLYTLPILNLHLKSAEGRRKYGQERFPLSILNDWNYMGVQAHNLTDGTDSMPNPSTAVMYFGGFCLAKDIWVSCGESPRKGDHLWLLLIRREYSPMKKNWLISEDDERRAARKQPRTLDPSTPETQFYWQYVPWYSCTRTPPSPVLYSGVHLVPTRAGDGEAKAKSDEITYRKERWMGHATYVGVVMNHYQDQYGTPTDNQVDLATKVLQPEAISKDYKRRGACLNLLQIALGVHG
jgi:hypothetical protein